MQLHFTHYKREPNYLIETLNSLKNSDFRHTNIPIRIFLGSEETEALEGYECIPWVGGDYGVRHNVNINYLQALNYNDEETIICENDINYGRNWLAKLFLTICELEHFKSYKNYIVSCYRPRGVDGKKYLWTKEYYPSTFYGVQAMYYPNKETKNIVSNSIITMINDHFCDLLIAKSGLPMFSCLRSTIQHTGHEHSASGNLHYAGDFEE